MKKMLLAAAMTAMVMSVNAQTENKSGLNFDIEGSTSEEQTTQSNEPVRPTLNSNLQRTVATFDAVNVTNDGDVEVVVKIVPNINCTIFRMYGAAYMEKAGGEYVKCDVSGAGGRPGVRPGTWQVNHNQEYTMKAVIKKKAHLYHLENVTFNLTTQYGDGVITVDNINW